MADQIRHSLSITHASAGQSQGQRQSQDEKVTPSLFHLAAPQSAHLLQSLAFGLGNHPEYEQC